MAVQSPAAGKITLGLNGDVTDTEYRTGVPPAPVAPGDPFDFVPEYNVNLTADYTFNWSPEVPGFVSASSSWKGPMQNTNRGGTLGAVPIDRNEPVNLIDLIVGADVRGLELSVFARNLLDERGRLAAQFTGLWPQLRPRSIGMQVSKSF